MDPYLIVEVPAEPVAAAAVLNAQAGADYLFTAWLQPPCGTSAGLAIFKYNAPLV